MKPRTKTDLGLIFGGICALIFIDLRELDFNVFGDAVHFKKALVKLWVPLLLAMIWLLILYRASKTEDE